MQPSEQWLGSQNVDSQLLSNSGENVSMLFKKSQMCREVFTDVLSTHEMQGTQQFIFMQK